MAPRQFTPKPDAEIEAPTTDAEIADLLSVFAPPTAQVISAAQHERNKRVRSIDDNVRGLATIVATLATGTEDKKALADTLKSLKTVRQRATRAVESVPDAILDPSLPPAKEEDTDGYFVADQPTAVTKPKTDDGF